MAERSLGGLGAAGLAELDRHVAWCAACRKEAREFDEAAASLVSVLAPVRPAADLEDRVIALVKGAATGGRPLVHHRGRTIVAATVAAMFAVAGLGFGAVMAGRAARFRDQAATLKIQTRSAQATFSDLLRSAEFSDPRNTVEMGDLASPGGGTASGTALTLLAPSSQDLAIVTISSLQLDPGVLPLEVTLAGPHRRLVLKSVAKLDSGGSATVATQLNANLSYFNRVVIRDANGEVVLRGRLAKRELQQATPSP